MFKRKNYKVRFLLMGFLFVVFLAVSNIASEIASTRDRSLNTAEKKRPSTSCKLSDAQKVKGELRASSSAIGQAAVSQKSSSIEKFLLMPSDTTSRHTKHTTQSSNNDEDGLGQDHIETLHGQKDTTLNNGGKVNGAGMSAKRETRPSR